MLYAQEVHLLCLVFGTGMIHDWQQESGKVVRRQDVSARIERSIKES